jgi:hypothetical protein
MKPMTMDCEQCLFEISYLMESGEFDEAALNDNALNTDVFNNSLDNGDQVIQHLHSCLSCRTRLHEILQERRFMATEPFTPAMSRRIHQVIDQELLQTPALRERRTSATKLWLQMAFACLILIGSIIGISYQDHPTTTTLVYAHR